MGRVRGSKSSSRITACMWSGPKPGETSTATRPPRPSLAGREDHHGDQLVVGSWPGPRPLANDADDDRIGLQVAGPRARGGHQERLSPSVSSSSSRAGPAAHDEPAARFNAQQHRSVPRGTRPSGSFGTCFTINDHHTAGTWLDRPARLIPIALHRHRHPRQRRGAHRPVRRHVRVVEHRPGAPFPCTPAPKTAPGFAR